MYLPVFRIFMSLPRFRTDNYVFFSFPHKGVFCSFRRTMYPVFILYVTKLGREKSDLSEKYRRTAPRREKGEIIRETSASGSKELELAIWVTIVKLRESGTESRRAHHDIIARNTS